MMTEIFDPIEITTRHYSPPQDKIELTQQKKKKKHPAKINGQTAFPAKSLTPESQKKSAADNTASSTTRR
jgi:hypothetical protein